MNVNKLYKCFFFSLFLGGFIDNVGAQEPARTGLSQFKEDIKSDFSQGLIETHTHKAVRKIAVFPVATTSSLESSANHAWWKIREELTVNKRFLIASKQLMQRKEVFSPKLEIENDRSKAILLGKYLEADALIITSLVDRKLKMSAFSARTGGLLWSETLHLHISQLLSEQIETASLRLVRDFMASIPYQGFQIMDPLIGKSIYDEGTSKKAKIDMASDSRIEKGDLVQWIAINENVPVYQNNNNLIIYAEGHVIDYERGIATVEIKRLKDQKLLVEGSLIRAPKEVLRLEETMALRTNTSGLSPEIVVAEMKAAQPDIHEHKPVATLGSTLASLLVMILLAF